MSMNAEPEKCHKDVTQSARQVTSGYSLRDRSGDRGSRTVADKSSAGNLEDIKTASSEKGMVRVVNA